MPEDDRRHDEKHSSLALLHRLDMDVLTVHQAFTAEIGKTSRGENFFKAVIAMARGLGIKVVAEGVETEEQLRVLQSLSCDKIRGYFISRPVPASEMPALMQKRFPLPSSVPMRQVS